MCSLYTQRFSFRCSVFFLQFTSMMITYGIRRFLFFFFFCFLCPVFPPRSLDCMLQVSIGLLYWVFDVEKRIAAVVSGPNAMKCQLT